jgi:hypothetical protein
MKNPFAPEKDEPVTTIGHIFGVPLVLRGRSWLPVNQVIAWLIFYLLGRRASPQRPFWRQAGLAGLKMTVMLGSEWTHNLAHAAAARAVGQPMDALSIALGMPICVYHDPEAPSVTPRQHILRSAAGPAWNSLLLACSLMLRRLTRRGSAAREVLDVAVGMNTVIVGAGFCPSPALDGGPLLKWGLVEAGLAPPQADAWVRKANLAAGLGLLLGTVFFARRKKWLLSAILGLLGGMCTASSQAGGEAAKPA